MFQDDAERFWAFYYGGNGVTVCVGCLSTSGFCFCFVARLQSFYWEFLLSFLFFSVTSFSVLFQRLLILTMLLTGRESSANTKKLRTDHCSEMDIYYYFLIYLIFFFWVNLHIHVYQ
jgi:hypothetical protein